MKMSILTVSLLLLTSVCVASNPASTAYVDKQFAGIQAQIEAINANPAVVHPVGSCYGGGVVFYVNTTPGALVGRQGLIVALDDANAGCSGDGCSWANADTFTTLITAPTYFTGLDNTANIITNSPSGTPAASAANAYTTSDTCPTCTKWYLPSQYELYALYAQSTLNGLSFWQNSKCPGTPPITSTPYWSSSQVSSFSSNDVWGVNFGTPSGSAFAGVNTLVWAVRAIRAF